MTVRIVTDGACDLPAAVISELGIHFVPLYIHVGDQVYQDEMDMTRESFYKNLFTFPEYPRTAAPSPIKFRELYEKLAGEGATEILSIHISGTLSALVDVARIAARETTAAAVTVFDSQQISLGTGFLVKTAAQLARSGCRVVDILPVLNEQIKRTHVCAALDTLVSLRRSGRMNTIVASIGEIVQIKPLLKMYDGKASVARARTRKNAMKRLVQLLRAYSPLETVAFLHSGAPDQVQELIESVRDLLPEGEIWVNQINPVLGTHIGPGVVGFVCIGRKTS